MSLAPVNAISTEQNSARQILRIAAASAVYARAKLILAIQAGLTIVGGFAWAVAVATAPNLRVWAAFYSFAVALLDALVLEKFQSELRTRGAKLQEQFDCDLFHLPWRSLIAGDLPDHEVTVEEGNRYIRGRGELSHIKDWYPVSISSVPLPIARLICQRSNLWWDASLRRRYCFWLKLLLWLLVLFVFAVAIYTGMTVEIFVLAVLAPVTPAILWGAREIRKQTSAMRGLERLKGHVEQTWDAALNGALQGEALDRTSVELQNEIFHSRSRNPLIFNWVNKLLRDQQQRTMNRAADELVARALSRTPGNG